MKEFIFSISNSHPFLVLGAVALIALEVWAWFRLHPGYFGQGLPVFRSEVAARAPAGRVEEWLGNIQPGGFWGRFRFSALDAQHTAVREWFEPKHFWRPHYLPMMRAVLEWDAARGKVRLTGYLNYWLLLILLPSLILSLQRAATPLHAATTFFGHALLPVGLYIIQWIRYDALLAALVKQGTASSPQSRGFNGL